MGWSAVSSDAITGLQKPPRLPGTRDGSCSQARCVEPALVGGAGTPSAMLWAQQVPWTPSRGRKHSFSSSGSEGEAGLRSERTSRDRRESRGRSAEQTAGAAEQTAGACSGRALSQGRRHFSSLSGSDNASEKPSHWAAEMSNRSARSSSEHHSRRRQSRSPMRAEKRSVSEGSIRSGDLPIQPGHPNFGQCADAAVVTPQMLGMLQAGRPAGVHANALLADESSAEAAGNVLCEHESRYRSGNRRERSAVCVVKWLEKSAAGIPHQVLKDLKAYILKQKIDGAQFESLVTKCDVGALTAAVDDISALHLARLRKVMRSLPMESNCFCDTGDCEDNQQVAPVSVGPAEHCFRAQSEHRRVSPAGLTKPEIEANRQVSSECLTKTEIENHHTEKYLQIAIMHLAQWAGFEPANAIAELKNKLPATVVDELSAFFKENNSADECVEDCNLQGVDTQRDEYEHMALAPCRAEQSDRIEHDRPWALQSAEGNDTMVLPTRSVQRLLHHMDAAELGQHGVLQEVADSGAVKADPHKVLVPAYVAAWIRKLPESMINERDRGSIAAYVETHQVDGNRFTDLIAGHSISSSVIASLAPARIVKMRRAWDQVLREDTCRRATMDAFRYEAVPKSVKLLV